MSTLQEASSLEEELEIAEKLLNELKFVEALQRINHALRRYDHASAWFAKGSPTIHSLTKALTE